MVRTRGDAGEQLPPCAESLMVHSVVWPTAMMTVPRGLPEYCGATVTVSLSDCSWP